MKISIFGLGYVGLPLAVELSKNYKVLGFDLDKERIIQLRSGFDKNIQFKKKNLLNSNNLIFTNDYLDLIGSKIFIITVPTPVKKNKEPDLSLIKKAAITISKIVRKKNIIILESTVYPGVTRNIIGNIIEKKSKLKLYKDFQLAYSPERVNPGDKKNTIANIRKIIGATDKKTLDKVSIIYDSFLKNKIYKTDSIEIAEAAKVIENTQRDINIALINEFLKIFNSMNLDTSKILDAASTKWNFLNFSPGLVGGHCIGVDPYYLAYSAKKNGIKPNLILSGRKINESVPHFIVNKCLKFMKHRKNFKVLFLGLTFKEDCPDFRNSKSFKVLSLLNKYTNKIDIYDPYMDTFTEKKLIKKNNVLIDLNLTNRPYDLIMILVSHQEFKIFSKNYKFEKLLKSKGYIYDFKNILRENSKIIKN
tara:strand:+ start:589 stop:1848 length:1260 start_codon:yes stop_codon:yes gene_type:complete